MGGEIVKTRHGDSAEVEVPVLDDPKILAAHLDFIKRLGGRYDGHPDITRLDLGSVGWWGEWHMSRSGNASMPTPKPGRRSWMRILPPTQEPGVAGRASFSIVPGFVADEWDIDVAKERGR